jgi:spermidine synthase
MYHVISTGLTAILLYLISYFFYRIGFYSHKLHRKIWNSALAAAFLLTATAGLFLALQTTYKWNIPFIKTLLKWHVEFGVGMAVTGLFHFTWHLDYYGKLFEKTINKSHTNEPFNLSPSQIKTNLFIAGFVSSSIQFLLMREIMNITGGYELITGSFLGSWLIGSAIGASMAGKSSFNDIKKINLVFSLSPLISLILMLFISRMFLNPGESPSFMVAIIGTFLVLIPFCLVSGFTFIKLLTIAGKGNDMLAGKSFSIETTGGIVSGIILSIFMAGLVNTYKLLLIIVLLSVTYVVTNYYLRDNRLRKITKIVVFVLASLTILSNPDIFFRQILLPGVHVIMTKDTPYGNITKGKYKGEESLYYNQRLLAYNDDATEREEDIHYAMLQSKSPEKVILISGSLRSHLPEILKYPVKSIIYIERDPSLISLETSEINNLPGNTIVVNKDAYKYIRDSNEKVDVIILLIPPPSTLLLNRYYTSEFFSEVRKRLKPGGVFMCSPGPGENYFNKESLNLYSSIYNSLASSFKYIIPVVGNKLYFIASDNSLSSSFCQLTEKRDIKNIYVNSDFLDDVLVTRKSEELISLINRGIKENRSCFPVACFQSQFYQFTKTLNEKIPAMILIFLAFALPAVAIKRRNLLMYFSASALAGFEIILLLTLQIMIGNMYQLTGLIIAALMAGLAIGSGIKFKFLNTISLSSKVIYLLIFYMIFGLIYNHILELRSLLLSVFTILVSGFLPALFTGRIFHELTMKTEGIEISPAVYSADLAGSAFGFMMISGFAVPLFGIQVSIYLLSALIFGGILFGIIGYK